MTKKMTKTDTIERLKKAVATLDRAVQAWYKEHDPENTQRYATVHIRTYPYEKRMRLMLHFVVQMVRLLISYHPFNV